MNDQTVAWIQCELKGKQHFSSYDEGLYSQQSWHTSQSMHHAKNKKQNHLSYLRCLKIQARGYPLTHLFSPFCLVATNIHSFICTQNHNGGFWSLQMWSWKAVLFLDWALSLEVAALWGQGELRATKNSSTNVHTPVELCENATHRNVCGHRTLGRHLPRDSRRLMSEQLKKHSK